MHIPFVLLVGGATMAAAAIVADTRPNIVYLVVESTDGRTWTPGYSDDVLSLAGGVRKLQERGSNFVRHYSNVPVCCPSRASFWSGRHPHNLPHSQSGTGLPVGGAWNNYEGLPSGYSDRMDQVLRPPSSTSHLPILLASHLPTLPPSHQVLEREGYAVKVGGKRDWDSGAHTLNVRLNSWTMYTPFPYNINSSSGWVDEDITCASNGTVDPGTGSTHMIDWNQANDTNAWIAAQASARLSGADARPWFAYEGMHIVHPPYVTNSRYFDMIDPSKVSVYPHPHPKSTPSPSPQPSTHTR